MDLGVLNLISPCRQVNHSTYTIWHPFMPALSQVSSRGSSVLGMPQGQHSVQWRRNVENIQFALGLHTHTVPLCLLYSQSGWGSSVLRMLKADSWKLGNAEIFTNRNSGLGNPDNGNSLVQFFFHRFSDKCVYSGSGIFVQCQLLIGFPNSIIFPYIWSWKWHQMNNDFLRSDS